MTAGALRPHAPVLRAGWRLARLGRPAVARQVGLLYTLVAVAHGASAGLVVAGAAAAVAAYVAVAVDNDLVDLATDRRNARRLPLVTGEVSIPEARLLMFVALGAAVLAQPHLAQPAGAIVCLAGLAAGAGYSRSRRGLGGLAVLAGCYVAMPPLLALTQAGIELTWRHVLALGALVLLATGALAYKDVRDETGDRAAGHRSPLVVLGLRRMRRLAAALAVTGAVGLAVSLGVGPASVVGAAAAGCFVAAARGHGPVTSWARYATLLTVFLVGIAL